MVRPGKYLIRYVFIGTEDQREREVKKVRKFNTKVDQEMKEDYGKKIARKVA